MYEPSSDVWLVFRHMAAPYIRAHAPTVADMCVLRLPKCRQIATNIRSLIFLQNSNTKLCFNQHLFILQVYYKPIENAPEPEIYYKPLPEAPAQATAQAPAQPSEIYYKPINTK